MLPARAASRRGDYPIVLTFISSMEYELAGVRKILLAAGSRVGSGLFLYKGKALELLVTGVGQESTEASVRYLLAREQPSRGGQFQAPRRLLQLGFAGAVDPALRVGDLVLSSRYYPLESQVCIATSPTSMNPGNLPLANRGYLMPDPAMWRQAVAAAEGMGLQVARADSLTADRLVTTPEMKQELRDKYPVGIVNMEDYWAGLVARAAGVAYLSVRVVLDTAHRSLPGYLPGLAGSPVRAALMTAVTPWRIPTLVGLARRLPVAQDVLARFALSFLAQTVADRPDQPASRQPSSAGSRVPA